MRSVVASTILQIATVIKDTPEMLFMDVTKSFQKSNKNHKIHAYPVPVESMLVVKIEMKQQPAFVTRKLLVILMSNVAQNAWSLQIAPTTRHAVNNKSATILAQVLVGTMLSVTSWTTPRFAHVYLATLANHWVDVETFHHHHRLRKSRSRETPATHPLVDPTVSAELWEIARFVVVSPITWDRHHPVDLNVLPAQSVNWQRHALIRNVPVSKFSFTISYFYIDFLSVR